MMKPPLSPVGSKVMTPFDKDKGSLPYRISSSELFIMYGNRRYFYDILAKNKLLFEQIAIAKRVKIPVVLLIDTNLNKSEIVDLKNAVAMLSINVIKEIEFNFKDEKRKKKVEKQLNEIVKEVTE